jgi:predicted PurR-regulated permease PerM
MWSDAPLYVRATVKLLLLGLIVLTAVMAREFLIPFTIAVFFTFLLLPVSRKLIQWKFPQGLAIIISIVMAAAVFGGLIYFFYSQVASFSDDWPELKKKLAERWESIQQWIYTEFHVTRREQGKWIDRKMGEAADSGHTFVLGIFSATGTFLANLALIPIYIFFLTYYKNKFKEFILMLRKNQNPEEILKIMARISTVSQKYLKGLLMDVLILSVLNSTGFLLLGLKHAILFGVLASILNIIPYVGVLIGSILPVIMALLTKDAFSYAIGAALVCWVVQLIDNNFITPYVVGSSVSLNPFTAVIVLILGALIWGLPGMILCIPVAGMIKVICDNVESLKPYAFLMGEEMNFNERKARNAGLWKRVRRKKVKTESPK